MSGYEILELGPLADWGGLTTADGRSGKGFVDKAIATQYIGLSANELLPGAENPFWHTHSHLEEIYVFIDGVGEMALGDEVVPVGPGTTIRVGQDLMRAIRALPDSPGPLHYLCIRAGNGELGSIPHDGTRSTDPKPWH